MSSPSSLTSFIAALTADASSLGLIVIKGDPLEYEFSDGAPVVEVLDITTNSDPTEALAFFVDCADGVKWVRVNLVDGSLPGLVYNQLRNLATVGHLQILQSGAVHDMRWPQEVKIILVISRKALDAVAIPTFLNLFGPILREA